MLNFRGVFCIFHPYLGKNPNLTTIICFKWIETTNYSWFSGQWVYLQYDRFLSFSKWFYTEPWLWEKRYLLPIGFLGQHTPIPWHNFAISMDNRLGRWHFFVSHHPHISLCCNTCQLHLGKISCCKILVIEEILHHLGCIKYKTLSICSKIYLYQLVSRISEPSTVWRNIGTWVFPKIVIPPKNGWWK